MGRIDVVFGPAAVRNVKKMSKEGRRCVISLAETLREEMRPSGAEKYKGTLSFID